MATAGKHNGTLIGVYVGGVLVGASTSGSVDLSVSEIAVTSKDSAGRKEVIGGESNWSISGDFLDNIGGTYEFSDFYALFESKALVEVRFSTDVSTDKYYIGLGLLTSVNKAAPQEDVATGSFTFTGSGKLSEKTYT